MSPGDFADAIQQWRVKEHREDVRFAKFMFLVSRVAGADVELEDFLPPDPDAPEKVDELESDATGQALLNAYLTSCARVQAHRQRTGGDGEATPGQDH